MNEILDAFAGLFSITGILAFAAGVVATLTYTRIRAIVDDRIDPDNSPHSYSLKPLVMLWTLIFLMIGYIGVQEEMQAITVRRLVRETAQCEHEFRQVYLTNVAAQRQSDELAKAERAAQVEWLKETTTPPPTIAALHTTDPLYQAWAITMSKNWLDKIGAIESERQHQLDIVASHQLPEPQCGRR